MDWQSLFLSPNGRIDRPTFWIGFAIIFASSIVLNFIPFLGPLIGLALLWPQICVHTKRLHDMGRSGWLMLAPAAFSMLAGGFAVANGGVAVFAGIGSQAAAAALGSVMLAFTLAFLVGLGFLLWVGFSPSQPGDNRYGPSNVPTI